MISAQEVIYAIRRLRTNRLLTLLAILSLGLGIGASSAIFSTIDALILRELPVRQPERLVIVALGDDTDAPNVFTYPVWEQIRLRQSELFDGAFAWAPARFSPKRGGEVELIDGFFASGEIFTVLGTSPLLGNTFTEDDDRRGGGARGPVAVISYGFWQRRFGGAPETVGSTIDLGGNAVFTIVGVMPRAFFGPQVGRSFDVIVPLGTEPVINAQNSMLDQYLGRWLTIMARLRPGQTSEAASAALRRMQPELRRQTLPPGSSVEDSAHLADPFTIRPGARGYSSLRRQYDRPLITLFVVANLVLLIACANIANLLLASAATRSHDIAVTAALGAPKWQIARELLLESALIAGIGSAVGLLFARWSIPALIGQMSGQVNGVWLDVGLNWRVLMFTAATAAATALIFGTAPALRAARSDSIELLRNARLSTAAPRRGTLAGFLITAQVSLSFLLVMAAALLVRTYVSLVTLRPGFDAANVLVATVVVPPDRAPGHDTLNLLEELRLAIGSIPGVSSVAASAIAPVSGISSQTRIDLPGLQVPDSQRTVHVNAVSPDWFATYGTPVLAGRDFTASDRLGTPRVAIVNQAFARKFFGSIDPVGRTVAGPAGPNQPAAPFEIVGVAGDAVYTSQREPVPPTVYFALAQRPQASRLMIVPIGIRTAGQPSMMVKSVAAAIAGVNSNLQVRFQPLADQLNALVTQERLVAIVASFFGTLALMLAVLGIYGVTAHTVAARRRDIGIRMALGATSSHVVRSIVLWFTTFVLVGLVGGAILSVWAAQYASGLVFGVGALDPVNLVTTASILLAVGIFAAWLPARRAASVAPSTTLRAE